MKRGLLYEDKFAFVQQPHDYIIFYSIIVMRPCPSGFS